MQISKFFRDKMGVSVFTYFLFDQAEWLSSLETDTFRIYREKTYIFIYSYSDKFDFSYMMLVQSNFGL